MVESLEQRVVLSDWGSGNLLGSALNAIGVVTGPVVVPTQSPSGGSSSGQASQLATDIQALQKELAGLAATSRLTVADLTALAADSQAIAQAGARIDVKALDSAVAELATALTSTNPVTTQAQTDFQAVFASTGVPAATVTQAFNDLSKAITDSGIKSGDLATVAKDQAAIQSDLANLHKGHDGDSDDSGGTGSSTGGNGTSSSGSGSTTGSSATGSGSGCSNGGSSSSSGSGTSTGTGSTGTTSSSGSGSTTTGSSTPPSPTAQTATDASATDSTGSPSGSSTSTTGTATQTTKGHHHGRHSASSLAVTHATHTHARLRRG
jgi:hypothetical protein